MARQFTKSVPPDSVLKEVKLEYNADEGLYNITKISFDTTVQEKERNVCRTVIFTPDDEEFEAAVEAFGSKVETFINIARKNVQSDQHLTPNVVTFNDRTVIVRCLPNTFLESGPIENRCSGMMRKDELRLEVPKFGDDSKVGALFVNKDRIQINGYEGRDLVLYHTGQVNLIEVFLKSDMDSIIRVLAGSKIEYALTAEEAAERLEEDRARAYEADVEVVSMAFGRKDSRPRSFVDPEVSAEVIGQIIASMSVKQGITFGNIASIMANIHEAMRKVNLQVEL